MIRAQTPHDPVIASNIWPSFKPTLIEKHGYSGAIGKSGEDAALDLIEQHFPNVKYAISHDDALHQLLGIDITIINNDNTSVFIDVKTGSSSLYYTKEDGWYITLKRQNLITHKRTDALMHLGPKKDLFAFYYIKDMLEYCKKRLTRALTEDVKLCRRHWPDFIKTNLN